MEEENVEADKDRPGNVSRRDVAERGHGGCEQEKPPRNRNFLLDKSLDSRCSAQNADEACHGGDDDGEGASFQKQFRIINEGKGDDKPRDADPEGRYGRLHRVAFGEGGCGKGGNRDRRDDIGEHAEIEGEEMGREGQHTEFYDDGNHGDDHGDIDGGGRQPHPQNDREKHREDEGEKS